MLSHLRFVLPLLLLLLAGCSGVERSTMPAGPATVAPERPLPYPLDVEPGFVAALGETRTDRGVPGPAYWTQRADYVMDVRLFPDDQRLEGNVVITYHNNAPDALDRLHLELAQNLHKPGVVRTEAAEVTGGVDLKTLSIDGTAYAPCEETRPCYLVNGTQLVVFPDFEVASGASVEIAADWGFKIPQAGAGARMGHSRGNLFYLAYFYPAMSVYDDVNGWYTDAFTGNGEFYHEFGRFDVTLRAPAGWVLAATGTLQNPDAVLAPEVAARMRRAHASDTPLIVVGPEDFGRATAGAAANSLLAWRFQADQVRDFAFSATTESVWEAARTPVGDRDGDGMTDYAAINTFFRGEAPLWSEVTRYQQHAITALSEYAGLPYPWPHMTAVEGADIIGGGMEYPMMTLMGDYNARGDSALYNVTAHELAHMWVPLIVSNNERRFAWMDEGMTTFHENKARDTFHPGSLPFLGDQGNYLQVARAGAEGPMMRWSDYHYPGPAFGTASYAKPATVLRALEALLGEETFHAAWQAFIDAWAWKHPYPYDLFNTFEQVSGRDLDWFWRAWYYETWTLDQAVGSVTRQGDATTVTIADLGRVPMPVPLTLTLADGRTLTREVAVDVWLAGRNEATLTVTTASPVVRVEIDADRRLPDVDRSNNVWSR